MSLALAPEIWDRTIDFLHDDQEALQTCTLVCKSWLPAASYHLFSTITLDPAHCDHNVGGPFLVSFTPTHFRLANIPRITSSVQRLRIMRLPELIGIRAAVHLEYFPIAIIEDMLTRFPHLCVVELAFDGVLMDTDVPYLSDCRLSRPVDISLECFSVVVFPVAYSISSSLFIASLFSDIDILKVRSMAGDYLDWEDQIDAQRQSRRHNVREVQFSLAERRHAPMVSAIVASVADTRILDALSITEYRMRASTRTRDVIARLVLSNRQMVENEHVQGLPHQQSECRICCHNLIGIFTPAFGPRGYTALQFLAITLPVHAPVPDEDIFLPWMQYILHIPAQVQQLSIKFANEPGRRGPVVSARLASKVIRSFAWKVLDRVVGRQQTLHRLEIDLSILGRGPSSDRERVEERVRVMSSARVLQVLSFV